MSEQNQPVQPPPVLSHSDRLALDRTRLAYERTLLAWVRTAASMIGFRFTVYKFFQYLREEEKVQHLGRFIGPRSFAMLLISFGLLGLALATVQHVRDMKRLREEYGPFPISVGSVFAGLVAGIGILTLISVAMRQ